MKTLSFRKFTSVLLTITSLASPVSHADPMLRGERQGNQFVLRWNAASGTTQLVWAPVLDNSAAWKIVPGQVAAGEPDSWQSSFEMIPPKAIFQNRSSHPAGRTAEFPARLRRRDFPAGVGFHRRCRWLRRLHRHQRQRGSCEPCAEPDVEADQLVGNRRAYRRADVLHHDRRK